MNEWFGLVRRIAKTSEIVLGGVLAKFAACCGFVISEWSIAVY